MTLYRQWRARFAEALDGSALFGISYLDYLVEGTGEAIVMANDDAAIVVAYKWFPGPTGHDPCVKVIHGMIAAGDLETIVEDLIPCAERHGRSEGCRFAMIASREGWQRALRNHGYSPHQITLIKEL